ncbi:MAG: UDP-N-acetylmuramate-L-alanine ligase [candidate division TM6 bacterium GW2011_GWF2_32_72]|nr:MAG: UDP-N-acetylmuramate-L-alanine ligase [candidate division TM6 bacterium GW2011_GWF2_32_72]
MYKKKTHVHFVGIGGIGMSGIAQILRHQGYEISGCDVNLEQKSIKDLQALGCKISGEHNSCLCQDKNIDILVYSSAIRSNTPEIALAQQRGIPTIPRALMLAELMRTKYSIAISGAHGKTTTTSLVGHILTEAKLDPTLIVGGHLENISTNAKLGSGDFLVAEADESDRSLLKLKATLAIVTNIDLEHLETYKDLDDIKNTFKAFLDNLPFYGKAIVCADDENIASILPLTHVKTIQYGIKNKLDIWAENIELHPSHSTFNLFKKDIQKSLGSIKMNMPGEHNVLNCLAAIALCLELGLELEVIIQAIESFKGVDRRFSYRGCTTNGAEIFDDYGHHPKEIESTIKVAKKRTKGKLMVAFQPHRYTRTEKLWDSFVNTLANSPIDTLVITDIYPASEDPIENINSKRLVDSIKAQNPNLEIIYLPKDDDFKLITNHFQEILKPNDLLLLLGAGRINQIADQIKEEKTAV